jgi:hypothetical protein
MKFVIKGELVDLNTYIQKERGNRFAAAKIKEEETRRIYWECKAQKLGYIGVPVFVSCSWYCKNKRKDRDNVAFSKKFILDGLVKAGVLENDGWDNIIGFQDAFFVDRENPRIEVELILSDKRYA